jgi:hypothetical protein
VDENGYEKWSLKIPDDGIQFLIYEEQEDDGIPSMVDTKTVHDLKGDLQNSAPICKAQIHQTELNIPPGCAAGIETHAELDIPRIANSSIDNNSEYTLETIFTEVMATLVDDDGPQNYHDAMTSHDAEEWKKAMSSEWNSLLENKTFDTDT